MRFLLRIFLLLILLCVVAGGWVWFELQQPYYNAPTAETFVYIQPGAGAAAVADQLVAREILHTRWPFKLWLRFQGLDRSLKAGEYRFAGKATPPEIAARLLRGDTWFRAITIPEGLTARETIELLARSGFGDLELFQEALTRTDWIADFNPAAQNLEGCLFPETYRFTSRENEESIVRALVQQFKKHMDALTRELPPTDGMTPARALILASLIEKEVQAPTERPLVASVLTNRLRLGMTLGCDATIIYGMKLAGTWKGNLRKSDLQTPSPYNSYLNRGLPPGPICNPGQASIRAALRPAHTDYLYYVSKNDGTHQFSRNLSAHNQAVNQYQRRKR